MHLNNLIPFNRDFFIWDAVVAWRDYIFNKNFYRGSKGNYLTSMLRLIEANILDVRLQLSKVNIDWLNEHKNKIDSKLDWPKSTRAARKTCLISFYKFVKTDFNTSEIPYQRHPKGNEIEFILSLDSQNFEDKYKKLEDTFLNMFYLM